MKISEAKNTIRKIIRDGKGDGNAVSNAFRTMPLPQTIEIFETFVARGDAELVGADDALKAFLWENYLRFTTASTASGSLEGRAIAPRLLEAFATADGPLGKRAQQLRATTAKWRVANQVGFKPDSGWPDAAGEDLRLELEQLGRDEGLTEGQRSDVAKAAAMLAGARGDTVISRLTFELPHPLVRRAAKLTIVHQDIHAKVEVDPTSHALPTVHFDLGEHVAVTAVDGGAWPPGTSSISVTTQGLIDWTASAPAYSANDHPSDRSHAIPLLAADVMRGVLASLASRAPEELDGRWMPTASDVRSFELRVGTDSQPDAYHYMFLAPVGAQAEVLDSAVFEADIGEVSSPLPWEVARAYALGALRSARYFDAVMWANVGVEAFIDQQLATFAEIPGVDSNALFEATSVFAEAEEIIASTHPDLAGTISWPAREKAPSRFRQISGVSKQLTLRSTSRVLTKAYSRVSTHRNDAVHGRTIDAVSPEQAKDALAGLDRFVDIFQIEGAGECA